MFRSDQMDSPPVPVAVGSPACARKSFETKHNLNIQNMQRIVRRTIEKCVEVVVIHLTQFEEVLASSRTDVNLKVDDYVTERGL